MHIILYTCGVTAVRRLVQHEVIASYRTLYLALQLLHHLMPKTCYCGLKPSKRIFKYTSITPLLVYILEKKHMQEGKWLLCIFFCNHNYQEGTGELLHKASILGNKQLLSNMIDHEATYVSAVHHQNCLPHR